MTKSDYQRAIIRLQNSITELEKQHGSNSMEVAETYHTIGSMHQIQENDKEAKIAYQKALPIFTNWLGSEHPRVWRLKDKIGKFSK